MGGGGLCAASPWGVVGPRSVGEPRGWGVGSRSSVALPPLHGQKAGFVGVPLAMKGAVSILLRFVSVCFWPCAARGGRHGASWCSGERLAGQAGRPGAPQPLRGGALPACWCACRELRRLLGKRADGQGARSAWTQQRACRGARPWVSRRCGASLRWATRGGGGRGALPWLGGGICGRLGALALGSAVPTVGAPGPIVGTPRDGVGGTGQAREMQFPRPPSAPRTGSWLCCLSGGCGWWRPECCAPGPRPGVGDSRVRRGALCVRGRLSSLGLRGTFATACIRGHSPGEGALPRAPGCTSGRGGGTWWADFACPTPRGAWLPIAGGPPAWGCLAFSGPGCGQVG